MPHGGEGEFQGHQSQIFTEGIGKGREWDGWGTGDNPDRPPRPGRIWQKYGGVWYLASILKNWQWSFK